MKSGGPTRPLDTQSENMQLPMSDVAATRTGRNLVIGATATSKNATSLKTAASARPFDGSATN